MQYVQWVRRFILFHVKQHPHDLLWLNNVMRARLPVVLTHNEV